MKHYSLTQRIISQMYSQQTFCKLHFASWGSVAHFFNQILSQRQVEGESNGQYLGLHQFQLVMSIVYMYIWRIKQWASSQAKRCMVTHKKTITKCPKAHHWNLLHFPLKNAFDWVRKCGIKKTLCRHILHTLLR